MLRRFSSYISLWLMASAPQTSSTTNRSTTLTVRVVRELLASFDALAEGRGGRSALLRTVLQEALKHVADAPRIAPRADSADNRVSLRFTDAETAVLDHRAAERGVNRAGWIKALVRRHISLKGTAPMEKATVEELESKHAALHALIDEEEHRTHPDEDLLHRLKKEKLRLKDELANHVTH